MLQVTVIIRRLRFINEIQGTYRKVNDTLYDHVSGGQTEEAMTKRRLEREDKDISYNTYMGDKQGSSKVI